MGWVKNGIVGRDGDAPPRCAGNFSGCAVVLGCGRSVWSDIARIRDVDKLGIIAVNNMILHYKKRVHHGVSMHPEEPNLWRALRACYQGEPSHVHTHSYRRHDKPGLTECDYVWGTIEGAMGGTSSILAVMIGLALGYDEIILAGVPLDGDGHFYDPPGVRLNMFNSDFIAMEWLAASRHFAGRVRSMSGQTREWLGEPDARRIV